MSCLKQSDLDKPSLTCVLSFIQGPTGATGRDGLKVIITDIFLKCAFHYSPLLISQFVHLSFLSFPSPLTCGADASTVAPLSRGPQNDTHPCVLSHCSSGKPPLSVLPEVHLGEADEEARRHAAEI